MAKLCALIVLGHVYANCPDCKKKAQFTDESRALPPGACRIICKEQTC
jgi:hypothetical protein